MGPSRFIEARFCHEHRDPFQHPSCTKSLTDPSIKKALQELRQADNLTNWIYLIRAWVFLGLVIGGTIWFYHANAAWGGSFLWNVPVTLIAMFAWVRACTS